MKLVLASRSERRKELLSWLGVEFEVEESGFDESGIVSDDVEILVGGLALAKAQTVAEKRKNEAKPVEIGLEKELAPVIVKPIYVLGADTVVYLDGQIIGKPRDLDNARQVLSGMRGREHKVFTGVALVEALSGKHKIAVDESVVVFKNFSDEELESYLASSEPLGKAGSYMIMGKGKNLVESVKGSVTNVTGLPLLKVVELLDEFGIKVEVDVEETVKRKTGYSS